jgi:hypothetical protein
MLANIKDRSSSVDPTSIVPSAQATLVQDRALIASAPLTDQLFSIEELVSRNHHVLKATSVRWAARNRFENGAEEAFYKTRSGQLLVDERAFVHWYLNLESRNRPRASSRRRRSSLEV